MSGCDGVVASLAKPRLALLAGKSCLLANQIAGSDLFDCRIWRLPEPQAQPLPWAERLYRALDRRLFGRRPMAATLLDAGPADAAAIAEWAPDQLVCLSNTDWPAQAAWAGPVLQLRAEGFAGSAITSAVRIRLGQTGGQVRLQWLLRQGKETAMVFEAGCALDHRSLQRSLELVLLKCPMALLGALRRLKLANRPPSVEPVAPAPLGAGRLLWRLLLDMLVWPLAREQWRLRLYRRGSQAAGGLTAWRQLDPGSGSFWADPFVHQSDGGDLTVFFEALPYATGRGHISALQIDAQGVMQPATLVLQEDWHLSYPFLLEHQGRLCMIPESSANCSVDLYVCDDYPFGWRKLQTLISGLRLADATLHFHQGRWWMFAVHGQPGASMFDELHLFWSVNLEGPWQAHALNPVKINARHSRPAGALFEQGGKLIRPVQDCADRYGGALRFNQVLRLDEYAFEERELDRFQAPDLSARVPVHTYNASAQVVCVDSLHLVLRRPRWF